MMQSKTHTLSPAVQLISFAILFFLAGCANNNSQLSYPNLAEAKRITEKILTPKELEQAIDELQLEQQDVRRSKNGT